MLFISATRCTCLATPPQLRVANIIAASLAAASRVQ